MFIRQDKKKIKLIKIDRITVYKDQPRKLFYRSDLLELKESIEQNGILQPITVRKSKDNFQYIIVTGERRFRAAILAKLDKVPCIVVNCDEKEAHVYSLLENLQRVDLSPLEEARGINKLIKELGLTQEEVAKKLGKSQSAVANKLRLLTLTEDEQKIISDHKLTERHARALLRIKAYDVRKSVLESIISKSLNVQQTESLISEILDIEDNKTKNLGKKSIVIKDVRIFLNTITKAVDTMKLSGIKAETKQNETDEYIECIVKIPKESAIKKHTA